MRPALLILLPLLALAQACTSASSRPQAPVAGAAAAQDREADFDPRIVPLTREQDASLADVD